jgi:hypothetical protein
VSGIVLALAGWAQAPTVGSCPVFPANNIWNIPVNNLAVSSQSATYVNTIGSGVTLHPDFGTVYDGAPNGIPYITVPGTQTMYPATFTYSDESDPGPYAIPLDAPIEGGSQSTGDRHVISIDTANCILYEMWSAYPQTASWQAGSGAIFDLNSNALRPAGWTSADAAGLPIFPGLVKYDEVLAGAINHAIRLTIPQTQDTYVWPARHEASSLTGSNYPPMGVRFRLMADYDISGFSATNQIILTALKKYGMMVADNGSAWYISGAPDPRWNDDDLHNLTVITGADFEAVDVSSMMVNANSGRAETVVGDFAGTGHPGLMWQYNSTGQVALWYMGGAQGTTYESWSWLAPGNMQGWTLISSADFNGDGQPDLLWEDNSTGQAAVWYMGGAQGNTYESWAWMDSGATPGTGWTLIGAADFNGDGHLDLIWQYNSTGQVAVWYMGGTQGTTYESWTWLAGGATPGAGWTLISVADFNHDGIPDLAWQNNATGQIAVWYMGGTQGATYESWAWMAAGATLGTGWSLVGAVDVNGDGYPDLIWQNDTTQQVAVWYMGGAQGATYESWAWMAAGATPGPGWTANARFN